MKLDEIARICRKASPEPWGALAPIDCDTRYTLNGPKQFVDNKFSKADAQFIVTARSVLPKLLRIAMLVKANNIGVEMLQAMKELER